MDEKYTIDQVIEALRQNAGINSAAAKALDCSPATVGNYIERYPEIRDAKAEIREGMLDLAEAGLIKHIRRAAPWAIKYFLSTQGKHRGYVKETHIAGKGGGPIYVRPDLSAYSTEQLRAIRDIHAAAADAARAGEPAAGAPRPTGRGNGTGRAEPD